MANDSHQKAWRNPTIFLIPTFSPRNVEDLEAALEQFRQIAADFNADVLPEKDQYLHL